MYTFTGVSASAGIAIGPVEQIDHGTAGLHRIVCDPFRERALYDVAVVLAKDELRRLSQRAKGPDADILLFQIALLEDESFTNEIGDYIAAGAGGAAAVERAEQIFAGRLNNVDDEYIRERSVDVCDVCRRVVDILDGRPRRRLHLKRPSILVADRFFPSDLFSLDRRMILGLASNQDSSVSHAAIMARSMGIPAVIQLGDGVAALAAGHRAILDASDGDTGTLIIEPDGTHMAQADCKVAENRLHGRTPDPVAALPCLTRDGTAFRLLTATNATSDPGELLPQGSAGIGLLRTESVIMDDLSEDAQFARIREKLQYSDGAMVAVRTCDTHADDDSPWTAEIAKRLQGHRLFWPQIKALLRAAPYGDLRLLFPMIAGVEDWDACMNEVETCRQELYKDAPDAAMPPFGCIVDTPSAALLAGELIEHGAQMLAIDIEDLTRYTLGLIQDSTAAVAKVDNPAVRRLVKEVLQQAEARGVEVYLCGITVESIARIPVYLHLGIRTFSVEPAAILPLKKLLMQEDLRQDQN
ncbi:putative PEP-binding protein [Subdoligranulum variabile]|uniref:PEP-utilizing enzyme, TIM barrel domain protein n=1 Tax=Subdoligranulum variabile DSM 15176 TaxID=411471 RepID=D1PLW1_9FIRM|nr:putative PEP-binding protein [Subdoligranulum variabile]EFB76409.1 PEP-utilizing enzyme, TIM barrel domain protein [Subdoligranulum variabile DSM 15176]UWP67851.1 PEP-utilizing enzyme [Subdoligranulum variabile]